MLGARAGQLGCAPDGMDALFLVDGTAESFGNVATFQLLEDLQNKSARER